MLEGTIAGAAMSSVLLLSGRAGAAANEIRIGATAGPYTDQLKLGIKPWLENKGYTIKVVESNDYVRPNIALSEGDLEANPFQHTAYLNRFASEHKLDLTPIIAVPTEPIAIHSKKH
ncbi:MAG: MetQ/NlpA family ABC transporter substrate-binding protein, partial [Betaproteobacteria bacterium]